MPAELIKGPISSAGLGLLLYLGLINSLCFAAFTLDKSRACRKRRRISERTLLLLALAGGCPGGLAAMYLFHHKTKKPRFSYGLWLMLILWLGLLWYLQSRFGLFFRTLPAA